MKGANMNDLCIEILGILNFKVWDDKIKLGLIKAKVERAYERNQVQGTEESVGHKKTDA